MTITEANVNKIVIDAVTPYVPACVYGSYTGTNTTYCYFLLPKTETLLNGDDDAVIDSVPLQLHLFCPSTTNFITLRKQIKLALKKAGFTKPNVTCLFETDTKLNHIIFECDILVASEKAEV